MVKKINPDSKVFGFLMGPHGVYSNNFIEICSDYMNLYRNMGGFDMICKYFVCFMKISLQYSCYFKLLSKNLAAVDPIL